MQRRHNTKNDSLVGQCLMSPIALFVLLLMLVM